MGMVGGLDLHRRQCVAALNRVAARLVFSNLDAQARRGHQRGRYQRRIPDAHLVIPRRASLNHRLWHSIEQNTKSPTSIGFGADRRVCA
jgi:hypothetical protein